MLYRHPDGGAFPADWSRDGKRLLVTLDDPQGRPIGMALVPSEGGASVLLADRTAGDIVQPRFSPSGDRVAFTLRTAGALEVYVLAVSDRRRVRVSVEGGANPIWGPDGRELFFLNSRDEIMRAPLDGMTVTARPQMLFQPCASIDRTFEAALADLAYDVAPDGARFLASCSSPDVVPAAITTVVNWQARLK